MLGSSARIPNGAPGIPTLLKPVRKTLCPVMNADAACRAALLAVVVRKDHALVGDAIDVGCAIAHHTLGEAAQIRLPDVIPQMMRMLGFFSVDVSRFAIGPPFVF